MKKEKNLEGSEMLRRRLLELVKREMQICARVGSKREENIEYKDWAEKEAQVSTLRLDAVAKILFAKPRRKIEESIATGKILLNQAVLTKKSAEIATGDQVDIISGVSDENPALFAASRALVTDIRQDSPKSFVVSYHYWSNMLIHQDDLSHLKKK